jgi:5-methylcytosine-specific restriction endonuclease McrA
VNKTPWEECPQIWATQAQYFNWLRGSLRKIWSDYPLRKEFKNETLRPVTPEERKAKVFHPSTKNVGECVFCHEWFAGSKLEVDHKVSSEGCTNFVEANDFLWYCARASKEEMQLACNPCHKIETYREQRGITFEEARVEKLAIAFIKDAGKKITHILTEEYNFSPDQVSNDRKRRGAVKELIVGGAIK